MSRVALSAAKSAVVGAAELGVLWLGVLAFIASVENADNVRDALGNALVGVMIWLPLILVATLVVGYGLAWAVKLPCWGLVVTFANVVGVAALELPGGWGVRGTAVVALFAVAGAVSALIRPTARVTASS